MTITNPLLVIKTMFNTSWQDSVEVKSFTKGQVKRKSGMLTIGKTTGYTARWLYRLLKKYCTTDEQ